MGRLYADGEVRKLTAVITSEVADPPVVERDGTEIDWLVNENCETLVMEGHIDLTEAEAAIRRETGAGFPRPRHTWMRFMSVPDGELNESEDLRGWRGECARDDRGAEPVTISVRNT